MPIRRWSKRPRAFRWKRLLENGTSASISEMPATEKLDRGYFGRILVLTLLAADIVELILDGRQRGDLSLPRSMKSVEAAAVPEPGGDQLLLLAPARLVFRPPHQY